MLQSPGSGRFWRGASRRKLLKELSESYSALLALRQVRWRAVPFSSPLSSLLASTIFHEKRE